MLERDKFLLEPMSGVGPKPCNSRVKKLAKRAVQRILSKNTRAQACYKEMNRSLKSRFNPHDLYSDILPLYCFSESGNAAADCYDGLRFVLCSSVGSHRDIITVKEIGGKYYVYLGDLINQSSTGFPVLTRDKYEERMVRQHIVPALTKRDFQTRVERVSVEVSRLYAYIETDNPLIKTDQIARALISRLGMEASAANLARLRRNVVLLNDDNFTNFIRVEGEAERDYPDTVLIAEIRHCRRCTAKWPDIVRLTEQFPSITFGLVILEKGLWNLKKQIFGRDLSASQSRSLVVPMFIFYKNGRFREILATQKEDAPPHTEQVLDAFARHYSL